MNSRIFTMALGVGLAFALLIVGRTASSWRLPGNQQGYEPVQPIAYSHRLHAGELEIDCLYCHFGAETSRHAGIPPANVCMNCHRVVTSTMGAIRAEDELAKEENRRPRPLVSTELQKLYTTLGLDPERQPDPSKQGQSIAWVQVHQLPDFADFDHRAHVNAEVRCQQCHGPVETMERVRQFESLSMGWCVNCHREANQIGVAGQPVHASIDCVTCHY